MRIGIYNRYWTTRGGAERYAGVMAEILSQEHEVELLGCDDLELGTLEKHLGLDLSRTRFRLLVPGVERDLAPVTAEYDLFINCTFLSKLPSEAERSVYVVLFPQRVLPKGLVRAVRGVTDLFEIRQSPVVPIEGFYGTDRRGSRWSRSYARLRIEPSAFSDRQARVRLGSSKMPWSLEEALLEIEAPGLDWTVEADELVFECKAPSLGPFTVAFTCKTFKPTDWGSTDDRDLGVCLSISRIFLPWVIAQGLARRLSGRMDGYDPEIPARYDRLVSISEFTRSWVEQRWGLSSEVLAPPVDTSTFTPPAPGDKERVILSVGRFFQGAHNKKHLEMLEVFRRMVDRGEIPEGWEYHLAGNLHRNRKAHLDYFARLERLAEGYPVRLLVDLPFDRLVEEYRRASIFWHAAGWGEDERRRPEKLEHFGITTCEAMSAGCIPVVIAKAGQLEIVEHGESGFFFTDTHELEQTTARLIRGYGEPWTHDLMRRASASVQRFGRAEFEARLWEILGDLGDGTNGPR